MMPFRMFLYVARILDRWHRDHPTSKQLPLVLPLVLYQGERPWTAATELSQLFDTDGIAPAALAALESYLPKLRIQLDAIRTLPEERLGKDRHLLERLSPWLQDFSALAARGAPGLRDLTQLVDYLLIVNGALSEFLSPLGDQARRIPMSVGERLLEDGMQKGMQKG